MNSDRLKIKLFLAVALVLAVQPCIAAEPKLESEVLQTALMSLSLPLDTTAESLQRIVEARCLNIPDQSSWEQIFDAEEAMNEEYSIRLLGLSKGASKLEIADAWQKREKMHKYRAVGLLPSASEDEFRARTKSLVLKHAAIEEKIRNLVPGKTVMESDKLLKPLIAQGAEVFRPYRPGQAIAYGLPASATAKEIEAAEKEEKRKELVRVFETTPDATFRDIELTRLAKRHFECIQMAHRVLKTESRDTAMLKSRLKVIFLSLEDTMRRFASITTRINYSAHREISQLKDWTFDASMVSKR